MAPELRLSVGLDLAFFRQQMRKAVNIAQSEFTAQLQVKFNRQVLNNEIRNLDRAIKRKKFNVELNLVGGLTGKQFDQIQARLDALAKRDAVEIPVSIRAAATGKDVQSTVAQLKRKFNANQQIVQGGGKLRFPVSIKSGITNADVTQFRRDVEGKLKGIKVKVKAEVGEVSRGAAFAAGPTGAAGLYEFMRTQGLSGGNMPGQTPTGAGRRARFQNAVEQATSKELERMLRTAEVAGRSKLKTKAAMQKKLLELDDIAMENILGNLKMQMQEPRKIKRSFLDQVARAVMYMAGVDPEVLRQQAAARRLPPAIDFPATVPSRTIPIDPSATGRALTGVSQAALPGQSIAAAKYLPSDLGVELKNILRNAAYAFVDSLNQRVRQVSVREIGQAQLAPSRVAGLLPSVVGRQAARYGGPGDVRGRRIAEAYARSAARGASVMAEGPQGFALGAGGSGPAGPFRQYAQPPRGGAIVPFQPSMAGGPSSQLPPGYFTGGKIQQALKGADQYLKQSRVPLTGAIQELGGEFGNAVKQVLLFGTAYKALAFIIDLPNQALSAATALQTFNNQLLAVTGSVGAANSAFSFIDGLAERFNVPLNSAREGFVRLYASMEPAGFAPEQIEGLFTGISKAAATFGLSADQVDRVTYAFSQMASKGQAMSEELKGQLGDVLPGSLALFARAAQMSIPEFTKALEDGAFKGEAFQALLRNVAKLMNTEFAQGAAGAAETLQGRMNDLGNSVQKMYESFEPLVGLASAQIFPQLTSIISDTTEAVQAFVAGVQGADNPAATLSSRGLEIYNAFLQVAEIGKSLFGIIENLGPTFGVFGKAVLTVVEALARLINTGVGGWLAKLAVQVALVTAALQLMAKAGIFAAIRGLIMLVTNTTGAITALKTLIKTSVAARIALGGLVLGTVLVFFEAMASKVDQANAKLRNTAKFARDLKDELDAMASAGDVTSATAKYTAAEQRISSFKQSIQILEEAGGLGGRQTTQAEFERLQRSGLASGLSLQSDLRTGKQFLAGTPGQIEANLQAAREGLNKAAIESGKAKDAMESAIQVRKGLEAQNKALEKVDITGEDEKGEPAKDKLKDYDRDLKNFYTNIARTESEAIKQRMDMTARQKEIALAVIDFNLKEKLAKAQYQRDIAKVNELVAADRAQYLADKKADLDAELKLAQQEFGTIVMSPFAKRAEDEVEAQNKLKASIAALKSGREELSAVEEAELFIQNELKGVTKEYADNLTPVIERLRQAAKETRNLTEEEKALRDQRKYAEGPLAEAQGRLRLAGIFNPAAELRERIRQRLGEAATPKRVEEIARLEESAAMMEDLKGAVQGVRDEFAGLFSTMITGSGSAQEALAQSFANIGKSFADMAGKMIAQWLFMKAIGLVGNLFGGGTPSVGPVAKAAGVVPRAGFYGPAFANGGIAIGGFQAFANGGIVNGPTLGLVGEGRYNEAVVPLPDGKSIPVELGGDAKNIVSNITVNVNNGQARSEGNGGANDLGRKLEGAVKQVIIEELRPGGVLAGKR